MQPLLFDAVVFDLDGTLLATDSFWVRAATKGAARAFAELRIERALPTGAEWMSMVGHPIGLAFERLFTDLTPEQRERVFACCMEEETAALARGEADLMPGALEMLATLRDAGLRLGIASNCTASYLETVVPLLGLAEFIEAPRCLDSEGIETKSDMVADVLATFDTRSALMVGDRLVDREAAWNNGLPHVHLEHGFATEGEEVACEAQLRSLAELVPCMRERASWIAGVLERVPIADLHTLGVTGAVAAGKTLFARDAARLLTERRSTRVVAVDEWDLEGLARTLLEPHARGESVQAAGLEVPKEALLILEGPVEDLAQLGIEHAFELVVSPEVRARRVRGRAFGGGSGQDFPTWEPLDGGELRMPKLVKVPADNPFGS